MTRRSLLPLVCTLLLLMALPDALAGRGGRRHQRSHRAKAAEPATAGFTLTSGLVAKVPAVARALEALSSQPDHPEAWRELGRALTSAGDYEDAVTAFSRLVDLEPDDADNYVDLGAAYLRFGELRRGIREFRRALEIEPFHALAHYNMGVAYQQLGEYDRAVESFRKAILIEPELGDPEKNVGAANNPDLVYVKLRVYLDTVGATPALFSFSNPARESDDGGGTGR